MTGADPTVKTVGEFVEDARRMSLRDFRLLHGDFFLVSDQPIAQDAGAFVAATRVATDLDKLEAEVEEVIRDKRGGRTALGVYFPRKGTEKLGLLSIGALEHNDIVVDQDSVSSDHAALVRLDGGYFVQDSGSTNGTFVNGERAPDTGEALALCNGDFLELGLWKVRFLTVDAFQRFTARAGS